MARINGPITVYNSGDAVPTDAEGGYAGGDSTAAAVGMSLDQSSKALGTVDNLVVTGRTLDYGQEATATITGTSPNKTIDIGIPKGMPEDTATQLALDAQAAADSSAQSAAAAEAAENAKFLTQDDGVATLINDDTAGPLTRDALQAREPWVNPKDHGAVGDGVTDDAAAIQAAIDEVAPTGGTVKIPLGRWCYGSDINMRSGVTLEGSGQRLWTTGTVSADRQRGTMLVPLNDTARVRIDGVAGMAGHLEAVEVRNLTIDGATTTLVGISVTNAYDVTLSDVYIRAVKTGITCATLSASDYVENLRLREVKITNGEIGIDSTGSASKGFIDSTGLHVRNMTQSAVKGAWTGIFSGGFIGRIGTAGAGDGIGFDLTDADGVTVTGVPFENVPTPIRTSGNSYGLTVTGIVTNSSSTNFGLVRGIDLQDCDGWAVIGCKFLYTNATADAVGIYGTTQARYGTAGGNLYQGVGGSQQRVSLANPGVNTADVNGRFQRVDADALYVGDGTTATSSGIGGAAGATRSLDYYTGAAGVTTGRRWAARTSSSAESGSDAGSDYELVSYNDSGAGTSVRARVRRSDGRFTVFAPFQSAAYATGSRPSAATAGVGAVIFDSTLGKPLWSNGSAWVDATGTAV